nr:hypothetical protein GCM10020092_037990 [Actinoplanes digitatis]
MVFLAQPGNPTGNLLRTEWIETVRATAAYVFLDETYQEFSSGTGVLPGRGGAAGCRHRPAAARLPQLRQGRRAG